jgi:hypothetical protein
MRVPVLIPVPENEQPGLAEEWAVQQRPEPPTRDLRRKRRAKESER